MFRTQKRLALCLFVLGVLSCFIEGDGTVALLLIPMSTWLFLTKKKVIS